MQLADKLVQIAENELKVYNDGKFSVVENIEPFYGQEQGLAVVASNVTTVDHELGVKLSSKNLFNEAEANITKTEDYFESNVSYWQAPCFALKVESGATYTATVEYYTPNTVQFAQILAFTFSREKTYTNYENSIYIRTKTQDSTNGYVKDIKTFTIPDGVEEIYFIANNDETYFKNVMVEKNSTPTAYAPFVADFSDCKVKVIGKNLFDKTDYHRHSDGTIGFSVKNLVEGETYTISTNIPIKQFKVSNAPWGYSSGSANNDNGFDYHTWKHTRVEQISESATLYIHFILVGETSMVSDISQLDGYEIQIEYGATPTEYTEYIEPIVYTAAVDGTVEGVKSFAPTMTLTSETNDTLVNANYIKDIDKVFEETITQIALSGGE